MRDRLLLMGGFYYATWNDVYMLVPIIIPSFLIMWALGWKLNILSMGDDEARALGVNPEKYKMVLVVLATLISLCFVLHRDTIRHKSSMKLPTTRICRRSGSWRAESNSSSLVALQLRQETGVSDRCDGDRQGCLPG